MSFHNFPDGHALRLTSSSASTVGDFASFFREMWFVNCSYISTHQYSALLPLSSYATAACGTGTVVSFSQTLASGWRITDVRRTQCVVIDGES